MKQSCENFHYDGRELKTKDVLAYYKAKLQPNVDTKAVSAL